MTELEIFLKRAEANTIKASNSCYLYQRLFSDGYGRIWWKQKSRRVHKLAWELSNGAIAPGFVICHTCINRNCWNLAHVYLGTYTDNNQDTFRTGKGRLGEDHANSLLTEKAVREIRLLRQQGWSYQKIAKEIGCNWRTVGTVIRGETWSHVK